MHAEPALAGLEHQFAILAADNLAETQETLYFGRFQRGKCLMAAHGESVVGFHPDSLDGAPSSRYALK